MSFDVPGLVQALADQAPLLIGLSGLAAFLEAGLGLGAVIPGETVVVLGAAVLGSRGWAWVLVAVVVVGVAASLGDHFGYWVGRKLGPALRDSKVVASMGQRN